MKTYRIFRDIKANSKEEALQKLDEDVLNATQEESTVADIFRVQENPFDDEEEGTILEIARVAMSNTEVCDYFANELDLSDQELKALIEKIESITNRP